MPARHPAAAETLEPRRLLSGNLPEAGRFDGGLFPGGDADLAYDDRGTLHLAYYDANDTHLKYASRPEGGTWSEPRTLDDGPTSGLYADVATDGRRVAVSYFDAGDADLRVAVLDGGKWKTETVDAAGATGMYTAAAFGTSGELFVSYYDRDHKDLKVAERRADGSWAIKTIDAEGDVGRHGDLAVDPKTGGWVVAYEATSANEVRLAREVVPTRQQKRDVARGRLEPLPPFTVEAVDAVRAGSGSVSLVLGPGNEAALSFLDAASGDVRFLNHNSVGWTRQTVLPGQFQGHDATLWYDRADGAFKLLSYNLEEGVLQLAEDGPNWRLSNLVYAPPGADATKLTEASAAVAADGTISFAYRTPAAEGTPAALAVADRVRAAAPERVTATAVSGSEARVDWLDRSGRDDGYLVEASSDGATFFAVGRAPRGATGAYVSGLEPETEYSFRASALVVGVPTASGPSNLMRTLAGGTSGWFRVTGVSPVNRGEASYSGSGQLSVDVPGWVYAGSWQGAVYQAVGGSISIVNSQYGYLLPVPPPRRLPGRRGRRPEPEHRRQPAPRRRGQGHRARGQLRDDERRPRLRRLLLRRECREPAARDG